MSRMCLDFPDNNLTAGEPYIERNGRLFCPKCLVEIVDDPGYGLAYGGMGTYWTCDIEACDWFYKVMDPPEAE